MSVKLNDLIFETAEGSWRTQYVTPPNEPVEGDKITCLIRFKWIDPNYPENKATPERYLRLGTYHMHEAHNDYEEKLINALRVWIDSTEESEAVFTYPSVTLELLQR